MKKTKFLLASVLLGLLASSGSHAVVTKAAGLTLKIYNWADYIYEQDLETDPASVIAQFEAWATIEYGQTVTVSYSTFDTNETMYNQVAGLGEDFDLICPSDYMIQKMGKEGLLEKFNYANLPNYTANASPYLVNRLDNIAVGTDKLSDYMAGYMWGTMGLIFNPEEVLPADMTSWASLWSSTYYKESSVKDSMRDTYLVGLIYTYRDEINALKAQYEASTIDAETYNAQLTEILNRRSDEDLAAVLTSLKALKENIYGLEVDSGKNDIVTGKININVAWSGDAVYSMDVAEEEADKILNYSVPEEGSNIWFDGWVMPLGANTDLAEDFVNFLSDPAIAILNMDYIGYTSFIAGQDVLDRVNELYGTATGDDVDLSYFFSGTVDVSSSMVITSDTIGRQFSAQYPDLETITRCVVMEDFGVDNDKVVEMWSNFKATTLGLAAYLGIGAAILVAIGIGVYFFLRQKKSQRHLRQKAKTKKK